MNILITGGAGFIGSHLTDKLLAKGHNITVIDNLILGKKENIEHNFKESNFKFYRYDLLDFDNIAAIFKNGNFDTVFHLAANSDIAKSYTNSDIDLENTFLTTYNVLKLMREFEVKDLVFASSSAIYGETKEETGENFGPLFPVSHYGAGKLASEAFISSYSGNYGIKSWIVRFPNVVGERATHGVVFDFINNLFKNPLELEVLGDGNQYKPYLYVKDLVGAIIFIWENTNEKLNFYNVGVESRTRVKDIASMVIEEMGLDSKIIYSGGDRGWIGDVPEFNYNLDKIHALGWRANLSSDEAVRTAIKYILEFKGIRQCNLS